MNDYGDKSGNSEVYGLTNNDLSEKSDIKVDSKESLVANNGDLSQEKGIRSIQGGVVDGTPAAEQLSEKKQPDQTATSEVIHAEDEIKPDEVKPNIMYERNGYEYKTDEQGRTKLVTGDLDLEEGKRSPLQTEVGHKGLEGDEGGHLIGTRFNGPTDAFNIVPQDAELNRGEWKAMENDWAENIKNGKDVKVMIEPVYGDDSIRPQSFDVQSQVNGEMTYTRFLNQPGKVSHGVKNV